MTLDQLLRTERILPSLQTDGVADTVNALVTQLVSQSFIASESQPTIEQLIADREEQSSTGIGSGVAIPHCFTDEVSEIQAAFCRCPEGIDFNAIDRTPVKLVLLIITPTSMKGEHLKTLAAAAKLFNRGELRKAMKGCDSAEEMLRLLSS